MPIPQGALAGLRERNRPWFPTSVGDVVLSRHRERIPARESNAFESTATLEQNCRRSGLKIAVLAISPLCTADQIDTNLPG